MKLTTIVLDQDLGTGQPIKGNCLVVDVDPSEALDIQYVQVLQNGKHLTTVLISE